MSKLWPTRHSTTSAPVATAASFSAHVRQGHRRGHLARSLHELGGRDESRQGERLAQKLEENKDKISTLKLKAAASLENVKGTLEDKVKNADVQKLKEQVDSVREKSLTTGKQLL